MGVIPLTAPKGFTSDTNVSNYLLIVDTYYKIPKLYGMEKITTEQVINKLYMFQSKFGKIDKFRWWNLKTISADADTQFTSMEFKRECQTRGVHLRLVAPEHKEING